MENQQINHIFISLLPAMVTVVLLQSDYSGSWQLILESFIEKFELGLHSGWYNASVVFREKIILIFYLVIFTLMLAFLYGYTSDSRLFVDSGVKTIKRCALLTLTIILILTLLVFLAGRGEPVHVIELNESRLNSFLFNTTLGVDLVHLLTIQLSIYIGGYTRLLLTGIKHDRLG